jgi:rsbT antagonist protein RsbS
MVRIEQILLVTLQDEASAGEVDDLLGMVGDQVVATSARGVLIDVSSLSLVDSYLARMLASLAAMTRILGAQAIIAGVRPEVAIAMVELGAELPQIATALNVDTGLESLRQRIGPGR